jgi:hypothetical protein
VTAPAQPSAAGKGFFQQDVFQTDLVAGTVTCPAGKTATIPTTTAQRRQARFGARVCGGCPLLARCKKRSGGRMVEINDDRELPVATRQARWTAEFKQRYRERARSNARAPSSNLERKLPWRGLRKASAWLKLRMAALNPDRLGRTALITESTPAAPRPATSPVTQLHRPHTPGGIAVSEVCPGEPARPHWRPPN